MEFRKYEYGDIFQLEATLFCKEKHYPEIHEKYIDKETTISMCDGLNVVACGGFRYLWNGVYEVWFHPKSPEIFQKYKIMIIKEMLKQINKFKFTRIHAPVHCETQNHSHLMRLLHFHYEGLLSKFSPDGKDCCMYARTR